MRSRIPSMEEVKKKASHKKERPLTQKGRSEGVSTLVLFPKDEVPNRGLPVGSIGDEWSGGVFISQQVYDPDGRMIFHLDGYPFQPGIWCPCFKARVWILDPHNNSRYGHIDLVSSLYSKISSTR